MGFEVPEHFIFNTTQRIAAISLLLFYGFGAALFLIYFIELICKRNHISKNLIEECAQYNMDHKAVRDYFKHTRRACRVTYIITLICGVTSGISYSLILSNSFNPISILFHSFLVVGVVIIFIASWLRLVHFYLTAIALSLAYGAFASISIAHQIQALYLITKIATSIILITACLSLIPYLQEIVKFNQEVATRLKIQKLKPNVVTEQNNHDV